MIKSHNSDIELKFYNDRVKEVVDSALIAEPFTYIPIKAGHMELVGGNALVFGKITEGYDVINPDVDTELSYEDISSSAARNNFDVKFVQIGDPIVTYPGVYAWDALTTFYFGQVVTTGSGLYYRCNHMTSVNEYPDTHLSGPDPEWSEINPSSLIAFREVWGLVEITLPTKVTVGEDYYIDVENATEGLGPLTGHYQVAGGDTYVNVKVGLQNNLVFQGVDAGDIIFGPVSNVIYLFSRSRSFQNTPHYEVGTVDDVYKNFTIRAYKLSLNAVKFGILKCGATHGFGIVYKDRSGRLCSVMKTANMSVYIPFYAEETTNLIDTIAKLKFKIYHKPPNWSETYEIVYYGNLSMDFFLQLRADDITSLGADRYSLNINETLEYTWGLNNRWKVPAYVWEPGDRIRLIGSVNVGTGVVTKYTTLYDYEIEETGNQDDSVIGGEWLIFQAVDTPVLFATQTNIIVEVYRPRKGLGKTVPYGTGMVFEIGTDAYGNKYHKGDVDQIINNLGVCTTVAEVENTANDSWKFIRLNYEHSGTSILPFWAESSFPSDWWGDRTIQTLSSKLTSNGFPFLDDLSLRQMVLDERLRHGGFLVTGTRTNNIAHFTFLDYLDLPKKNGDITGLREIGYTLKVLQMHKETSIYINRVVNFNADGTEEFTLTDKFLGTVYPMNDDYGCQHPNSVMVNDRNLYYWDNNEGAFVRSSPNGQRLISDPEYKISRWFKDLLQWINESGGHQILDVNVGANNEHEEVWATFRMNDEVRGFIFSEKQGRFVSHLNQITESYIHLGNFFAHLYHQRLWIMNIDEGQDWLSWSGTPTYADVEVVSNVESTKNKVFNAIQLFADHLLQSLSKYIHIPAEGSGSDELMETNAPIFDRREGIYFGEIMKDENSPGSFSNVYDRKLNGREMRGRYCFFKFKTEEHDEKVRIDSICITSTLSERNV